MPKILPILVATGLLSLGLLQSCSRSQSKGTTLAEVGDTELTLEEIRHSFPAEFEHLLKKEQYLDFVKRWIEDEVVYQEALKNKLDKDSSVQKKIERMKRKILIEEYFSALSASEGYEPDDVTLSQYYEMNKDQYRRQRPAIKFAHIRFKDLAEARRLRWQVNPENFLAMAAEHSLDPVPESLEFVAFKAPSEISSCLIDALQPLRANQSSAPVNCPDGVYLLRVVEKADPGDIIPFDEARDDISATLVMNRREKLLQNKIADLKQNASITLNVESIPGALADAEPPQEESALLESEQVTQSVPRPVPSSQPAQSAPAKATTPVRPTPVEPAPARLSEPDVNTYPAPAAQESPPPHNPETTE